MEFRQVFRKLVERLQAHTSVQVIRKLPIDCEMLNSISTPVDLRGSKQSHLVHTRHGELPSTPHTPTSTPAPAPAPTPTSSPLLSSHLSISPFLFLVLSLSSHFCIPASFVWLYLSNWLDTAVYPIRGNEKLAKSLLRSHCTFLGASFWPELAPFSPNLPPSPCPTLAAFLRGRAGGP